MKLVDLPVEQLLDAPWNPNRMDRTMFDRLRRSVQRFGLVGNIVVRPLPDGTYEVVSGHHRLEALRELEHITAPCVVLDLDDAQTRLLAQALNHIQGEDDLGLRAELLRDVLSSLDENEVLSVIPETQESLQALASLGQDELAAHLQSWQAAQSARLKHIQFQLTPAQLEVVEEVLECILPRARDHKESPNRRGTALYFLCKDFLDREENSL